MAAVFHFLARTLLPRIALLRTVRFARKGVLLSVDIFIPGFQRAGGPKSRRLQVRPVGTQNRTARHQTDLKLFGKYVFAKLVPCRLAVRTIGVNHDHKSAAPLWPRTTLAAACKSRCRRSPGDKGTDGARPAASFLPKLPGREKPIPPRRRPFFRFLSLLLCRCA